jgi:magnesium-transporting ATPase (P-type)
VQCVLSDKTGTLTKNVMAFVKCSIAGVVYEADTLIDFDPGSNQGRRDDGKTTSNHVSNDSSDYLVDGTTSVQIELRDTTEHETNKKSYGQTVTDVATATHTVASSKKLRSALVAGNKDVTQFLNHLSTCHTVVPEALSSREGDASDSTNVDASDDGSQTARFGGFKYQASSPDEEALVTGAALLGQRVVSNVNGDIVISRNAPTGCALGGVDTDVFFDPSASTNKSVAVATRVSEPFVDASSGFGSSEHAAPRRSRFSAAKEKLPHADDTGIDRVTVLAVNEFSSARKRMSIVVRDLRYPEGQQIRLRLKGADAAVLERCALPPCERSAKIDSLTRTHLDLFATEGLRTLVLAEKVLSDDEFRTWMGAYASASASLVDREEKLSQVAELIETVRTARFPNPTHTVCQHKTDTFRSHSQNCQLVGVTAVEDKLADGVPETISLLRQAGMLVWMLTGDKLETAVSIAHTCKLIDKEGDLVVVREIDFEKDGNFLQTKAFEAKEDAALGSSFGLVIEGGALQYALDTKNIRDFMTLCDACSGGVVCCRVSPIQKASVAEAMKKHRSQVVLGIGDGANDVGLIKVRFLFCFQPGFPTVDRGDTTTTRGSRNHETTVHRTPLTCCPLNFYPLPPRARLLRPRMSASASPGAKEGRR